jgi:DNA-binding transcriptional MocR family regulator
MFLHLLEPQRDVIMLACAAPERPPGEFADAYAAMLPRLAAVGPDIGYWPAGHPELREAIAARYAARGVPTEPEQILVTNGGQHGLSLLARDLVRAGDRVLVECPTYPGALEAFRDRGAVLRTLPAGLGDLAGAIDVHRPVVAYVVPTFHNPTGRVLPIHDRPLVVAAATRAGVTLVDDEVLAELGFPGEETPPPLAAWSGDVITLGSFSKTVWGGLRLGWVRARADTVGRLARMRAVDDLGGNIPAQLAAIELLPRLTTILQRTAAERQRSHETLHDALRSRLPEWDVAAVRGGQTLWVRLPYGDGTSYAQTALRHGVAVLPGAGLDAYGHSHSYLRLHFLHDPTELALAVDRLAQAWDAYHPPTIPTRELPALAI